MEGGRCLNQLPVLDSSCSTLVTLAEERGNDGGDTVTVETVCASQ